MKPLGTGQVSGKLYVDDVFSTYLYTGNGAAQTIDNGIDLAGEGGLVWMKNRSSAYSHHLYDTIRGGSSPLYTNMTNSQATLGSPMVTFNSSGFTLGTSDGASNVSAQSYASWTFRKAPKFFDIVTYTGNGVEGRQIPHELGVAPGMIIVKRIDLAGYEWVVWHQSVNSGDNYAFLNTTVAFSVGGEVVWGDGTNAIVPTDSQFTVSANSLMNFNGGTYVAYLFAHDPEEDGMIQCGSFTTDSGANGLVNLGWEPQYVLVKDSGSTSNWWILDTMRGMPASPGNGVHLSPNLSSAETNPTTTGGRITATGFSWGEAVSKTYIYMAIRRSNKPPESGLEVYNAIARTGTGAVATVTGVGFAPDLLISANRLSDYSQSHWTWGRLRGVGAGALGTSLTVAENAVATDVTAFTMDGVAVGAGSRINSGGSAYVGWFFRRAPGFFDVVCYTGTGVAGRTVAHGLGVAPELMIVKRRNGATNWPTYDPLNKVSNIMNLNLTGAAAGGGAVWGSTEPTDLVFSVEGATTNGATDTYVAYLFATLPGISKCGSYIGNGTSQVIPCGFSTGARFILIKRTDLAGDWYIWDTARGIIAANDPHLSLNTTAAEVTTDDSVDPDPSGFIVNQVAATNINVNAGSYIFLAIA